MTTVLNELVHGMCDIFLLHLMHFNQVLGLSLFQTKMKRQKTKTKCHLILLSYIISIRAQCYLNVLLCLTHSVGRHMFETTIHMFLKKMMKICIAASQMWTNIASDCGKLVSPQECGEPIIGGDF
jgi:hypothetical protein